MGQQIPLDESVRADDPRRDHERNDGTHEVLPDLAFQRLAIVNVAFVGASGAADRDWVLVDAGLFGTAALIRSAAARRFGQGRRPAAIVLTHGHFDHVGALETLAEEWDVPIFAHPLEHPYLTGEAAYPAPDPTVGGGLMALAAPLYPRGPIDVRARLAPLPENGDIPPLPGWRWIATPGHSAGHVSLWREADATLIAGDAFVTTRQESIYAAATQAPELHGPPMYYTPDWEAAAASVRRLAAMEPETVLCGHGRPMRGAGMRNALHLLAENFEQIAVPEHGRYVGAPSRPADGSAYVR
ncbi:MBL fold metallo-hydrolase [Rhodoplanes roseus]|uniref:MBL fold metallo-hydrolase n=1 Tax=Rhodoplanes roseus TaxID=29409 RepID=A0A327KQS1_9BRAD|nr:MBL fold metallo-hydrolase [Rhodoplanes roseus]RAI41290.1 MBL fold metallo-hydrolase [Rhodoplanes roseus]